MFGKVVTLTALAALMCAAVTYAATLLGTSTWEGGAATYTATVCTAKLVAAKVTTANDQKQAVCYALGELETDAATITALQGKVVRLGEQVVALEAAETTTRGKVAHVGEQVAALEKAVWPPPPPEEEDPPIVVVNGWTGNGNTSAVDVEGYTGLTYTCTSLTPTAEVKLDPDYGEPGGWGTPGETTDCNGQPVAMNPTGPDVRFDVNITGDEDPLETADLSLVLHYTGKG